MAEKQKLTPKQIAIVLVVFVAFISLLVIASSSSDDKAVAQPQSTAPSAPAQPTMSKADAQNELDEVIALGKKAGLVMSYEFSESASVVHVGKIWYGQTVLFKKDFLAKIATLKKVITGYNHFEVRDGYSDEKVAEVTSFSNSLEVYK